jgi:hypothetical protein
LAKPDFVFLALLESALGALAAETGGGADYRVDYVEFTAAAAVILGRFKLENRKGIAAAVSRRLTERGFFKASQKCPELVRYILDNLKVQEKLTEDNCKSIDRASEPFADIIGEVMSHLSKDKEIKACLRRVGFFLGRFVYIMDLFAEVLNDYKKGGFNPLVIGNAVINELNFEAVAEKTEHSVNFTLGALSDAYVQLKFERYRTITDNIINIGLKQSFYDLAEKKRLALGLTGEEDE